MGVQDMLAEGYRRVLEQSRTLGELRDHLLSVLKEFGFTQFSYVPIDPPHGIEIQWMTHELGPPDQAVPMFVSTFPKAWVDHYISQDYANVDPTFWHAALTLFPFRWDELYDKPWFTKRHEAFFDEAAAFGVRNGVTIPLHGPLSGLSTLNLAGDVSAGDLDGIWQSQQLELGRIALVTHEMMLRFLSAHPEQEASVKLTERERECLLWTSRGKTNWEVGEILNISSETVRFHLKNAMAKMGVYSQHHAAVRAVVRSLIFP